MEVVKEIDEESPFALTPQEREPNFWGASASFVAYTKRVRALLEDDEVELKVIDLAELYTLLKILISYCKVFDNMRAKFREFEDNRKKVSMSATHKRKRKRVPLMWELSANKENE